MRKNVLLFTLLSCLVLCSPVLAGEQEKADSSKYLDAVKTFADILTL